MPHAPFGVRVILAACFLVVVFCFAISGLLAHDSWISSGGFRNANGEWCCGEQDCVILPPEQVKRISGPEPGYVWSYLRGTVTINEFVPEPEAQPSPDGEYWRCRRSDGSRRCFFAPRPST